MTDNNVFQLNTPATDALNEILSKGAQQLLTKAVEAELAHFLNQHPEQETDGRKAVVRNGYLPERKVQTDLGDISVKIPKVRGRSKQGIKFNSSLIPPYLKRTKTLDEFILWLYLKGISTGDMQSTLESLLSEGAVGLSANTVSRLKLDWEQEYDEWS